MQCHYAVQSRRDDLHNYIAGDGSSSGQADHFGWCRCAKLLSSTRFFFLFAIVSESVGFCINPRSPFHLSCTRFESWIFCRRICKVVLIIQLIGLETRKQWLSTAFNYPDIEFTLKLTEKFSSFLNLGASLAGIVLMACTGLYVVHRFKCNYFHVESATRAINFRSS